MPLVGAWSLIEYESRYEDGSVRLPMGEMPQGLLIYSPNGIASVQMTRPGRQFFASGDWLNGTSDEITQAYESYLAYYGRYIVDEEAGTVTHHIESCTFPNWTNLQLVRRFLLQDDRLTLTTPPVLMDGGMRRGYLVWVRR